MFSQKVVRHHLLRMAPVERGTHLKIGVWLNNKAKGSMLASMSESLRTKLEANKTTVEIMESLQEIFGRQSEHADMRRR